MTDQIASALGYPHRRYSCLSMCIFNFFDDLPSHSLLDQRPITDSAPRPNQNTDSIAHIVQVRPIESEAENSLDYINRTFYDYLTYSGISVHSLQDKNVLEVGPGGNLGVALKFLAAGGRWDELKALPIGGMKLMPRRNKKYGCYASCENPMKETSNIL